jgi:hypothetical protein
MYEIVKFQAIAKSRKARISAAVGALCLLGIVVALILGRDAPPPPQPTPSGPAEGVTFFDIGQNTPLTPPLRDRLEKELGPAVTERWADLDLNINYPGFLEEHFPELADLNGTLKDEYAPMRPEEKPVKLTFRHTGARETPFKRVDLVFSPYSRRPIFFRIQPKKGEGAAVVETIEKKYGPRGDIQWDDEITWDGRSGKTLVWRHNGDLLTVTVSPDRYGDPSYLIVIYYVKNLKKTAEIKAENQAKREGNGLKKAF